MHLALAVGTLLIGQMINPNFDPNNPAGDQTIQPLDNLPSPGRPEREYRPLGGRVEAPVPRVLGETTRQRSTQGDRGRMERQPSGEDLPLAPTDPDAPGSTPTEGSTTAPAPKYGTPLGTPAAPGTSSDAARRAYLNRMRRSTPPTASRQPANLQAMRQAQVQRIESLTAPPAPATMRQPTKPFSSYKTPSGISPYLNMYRANQSQVENYNTLVLPQVEQRQENRVLGGEIRGLQSSARLQGRALQRLGKQNQVQPVPMAPEYFNNYQSFYPAFYH